jgi:hypothetical protein
MPCDRTDVHSALSPIITKLELFSRLSPMLDTDREYAQALAILNAIMADYVSALRQALDVLVETREGEGR